MAYRLKTTHWIIFGVCVALLVTATWAGMDLYRYAHQACGNDDTPMVFSIAQGEGFNQLTHRLQTSGIITSPLRFKLLARLKKEDKQLKAGEYGLTATMTPDQVLDVLVNGRPFLYRITIPEGFNLQQIAEEINRLGLTDSHQFKALATDPEVAGELGIAHPTLEGYLFPDTYYFPKNVAPRTIITKMVQHFTEKFPSTWRLRAKDLNLTIHEVVTLASIIEKETGDPSERAVIASVFHNRLKKKMRLESDPTVIYGIKNFNGNLTRKDLRTHTPYNTYLIKGLPLGPITNPGTASLEAALYPAKTNYLFFVAKKDGTHHFSTNFKDHNQAVYKYQLRRKNRRVP
jgi:UPF0755 protein